MLPPRSARIANCTACKRARKIASTWPLSFRSVNAAGHALLSTARALWRKVWKAPFAPLAEAEAQRRVSACNGGVVSGGAERLFRAPNGCLPASFRAELKDGAEARSRPADGTLGTDGTDGEAAALSDLPLCSCSWVFLPEVRKGEHGGSGSALRHAWKLVRCTRRCCELPSQESPTGGTGQQAAETELSSVCTTYPRLSVVMQHRVLWRSRRFKRFASESQCEQSPEANLSSIKVFCEFL